MGAKRLLVTMVLLLALAVGAAPASAEWFGDLYVGGAFTQNDDLTAKGSFNGTQFELTARVPQEPGLATRAEARPPAGLVSRHRGRRDGAAQTAGIRASARDALSSPVLPCSTRLSSNTSAVARLELEIP